MASAQQNDGRIKALEAAILIAHNSWPTHRGTIFVREETENQEIVWEGPVELFGLTAHETAKNCYAWHYSDAEGTVKILTVLENGFIDSAKKAVQAAIFRDFQPLLLGRARLAEKLKRSLEGADSLWHEAQIRTENVHTADQSLTEARERVSRRVGLLNNYGHCC